MSLLRVAAVSEIVEGKMTAVNTPAGSIALTRKGADILAFQNVCTHDDNPLDDGKLEGEEVVCPRHGARFNIRTGAVCRMPATSDIEVYRVVVSGEDVLVDVD